MIVVLTWLNTRGLQLGKLIQNVFTVGQDRSRCCALIVLGVLVGRNAGAVAANFTDSLDAAGRRDDHARTLGFLPAVSAPGGLFGLLVACSAWRRSARSSRPTPGTTSRSPRAR